VDTVMAWRDFLKLKDVRFKRFQNQNPNLIFRNVILNSIGPLGKSLCLDGSLTITSSTPFQSLEKMCFGRH
jgi:hypothetical protein